MEDKHILIPQLIQDLILQFVPVKNNPQELDNIYKLCSRTLNSQIGRNQDLGDISIQNKLKLVTERVNPQKLDRIFELEHQLKQQRQIFNKNKIISCLMKLSQDPNQQQANNIFMNTSTVSVQQQQQQQFQSRSDNSLFQNTNQKQKLQQNQTNNNTFYNSHNYDQNTTAGGASFNKTQSTLMNMCKQIGDKGNQDIDLKEIDLVSDVIFAFQGIDSHYIQYSQQDDAFLLKANVPVKSSVRTLVNQLCEIGWLFKKVKEFLENEPLGIVNQSLHLGIKEELQEYYRFITILENQKIQSQDIDNKEFNQSNLQQFYQEQIQEEDKLTLRKLVMWIKEPQERMKWLCIICDSCKNLVGCQVISQVFSYHNQGNQQINGLISRIISAINQPFMKFIYQWVYRGELIDQQSNEFFVVENYKVNNENLWKDKYELNAALIPSIIDRQTAQKIFEIGKGVNFLQKCCNYSQWQLELHEPFQYFDYEQNLKDLQNWVEQASIQTSQKIVNVLQQKFNLKEYFDSIKKILLMGQGDFIHSLMEQMTSELNKQCNQIQKNQLLGLLESAIRTSNIQYIDEQILEKLDINLLEASSGEKGWDIFSLVFHVENPISTVFSKKSMKKYEQIFNFLWRIKRVEYTLSKLWLEHMKIEKYSKEFKSLRRSVMQANLLRQEMLHYVQNLFNYIMVEVIETEWKNFNDNFNNAKDFASIIQYHEKFVSNILQRSLLVQDRKCKEIYTKIKKTFDIILGFKISQEMMIESIQNLYERRQTLKNQEQMMNIIGQTDDEEDQLQNDENIEQLVQDIQQKYKQKENSFRDAFRTLQNEIKGQDNLKFLQFKLDFNQFYDKQQYTTITQNNNSQINQNKFGSNINSQRNTMQQQNQQNQANYFKNLSQTNNQKNSDNQFQQQQFQQLNNSNNNNFKQGYQNYIQQQQTIKQQPQQQQQQNIQITNTNFMNKTNNLLNNNNKGYQRGNSNENMQQQGFINNNKNKQQHDFFKKPSIQNNNFMEVEQQQHLQQNKFQNNQFGNDEEENENYDYNENDDFDEDQ